MSGLFYYLYWSYNLLINSRFIHVATITTTRSPPFSCPQNGYYPVSACSSQYYLCVNGDIYPQVKRIPSIQFVAMFETIRSLQVCPNDSVFDPYLLYCVYPDQVPACAGRDTFLFYIPLSLYFLQIFFEILLRDCSDHRSTYGNT